jgi:hypothetical protein
MAVRTSTAPISLRGDTLVVLSRIRARNTLPCLYRMVMFAGAPLLVFPISCKVHDSPTSVCSAQIHYVKRGPTERFLIIEYTNNSTRDTAYQALQQNIISYLATIPCTDGGNHQIPRIESIPHSFTLADISQYYTWESLSPAPSINQVPSFRLASFHLIFVESFS